MSFNEKLQNLRKENKYSQEELADKLDVTRQSVSKWESGQTYPEMDKLLAMCKIFNCTLEELTNDSIKEINTEKKNNLSSIVDSGLDFINKTFKYFTSIRFNEFIKCAFIMLIVILLLGLLRQPFNALENGIFNTIMSLGETPISSFFYNFFKVIVDIVYGFGCVLLFIYIFKIGFLDKMDNKEDVKEEVIDDNNEEASEKSEVKEVIKHTRGKDYSFFSALGSVIMFFVKVFLVFLAIPFVGSFVGLFVGLVIDIYVLFKGLFYSSVLLGILSLILLNGLLLIFVFYVVFNKKHNLKLLLILFFSGIAGLGISGGLFALDINNLTFVNDVPKSIKMDNTTATYKFNKDLYIDTYEDTTFVIDNSLNNDVKIDVNYYDGYRHVFMENNNNTISFGDSATDSIRFKSITNLLIDNLKENKIYDYSDLNDAKIVITSSEVNIKVLKDNIDKKQASNEEYHSELDSLNEENNRLEIQNGELQRKLDDLQTENDELKQKIEDYKDRVSSLLD